MAPREFNAKMWVPDYYGPHAATMADLAEGAAVRRGLKAHWEYWESEFPADISGFILFITAPTRDDLRRFRTEAHALWSAFAEEVRTAPAGASERDLAWDLLERMHPASESVASWDFEGVRP